MATRRDPDLVEQATLPIHTQVKVLTRIRLPSVGMEEAAHTPNVDWLRSSAYLLIDRATTALGWSVAEVHRLIETVPSQRSADQARAYDIVAHLSVRLLNRRTYSADIVNGFYVAARAGRGEEGTFESGLPAMVMHGYPPAVIQGVPESAANRFRGLGNVWIGREGLADLRVVDIGCGAGVDLAAAAILSGRGASIVGIDKRPDLLGIAHSACPQASLILGNIAHLPMREGAFDLVLANGLPPLQRPTTLSAAASTLHALTLPAGSTAATVIVVAPKVEVGLAEAFPTEHPSFVRGMATLISGKPTNSDISNAFESCGAKVSMVYGKNPYRDPELRSLTALVNVRATRDG